MRHNISYGKFELRRLHLYLSEGYSLSEIEEKLGRSLYGLEQKLRRLRKKSPEEWNYKVTRRPIKPKNEEQKISKSFPNYNELEIGVLQIGSEQGVSLLEFEGLLGRPHKGIMQKLRKLYNENPKDWDHDILKWYQNQYRALNSESIKKYRREYWDKNKDRVNKEKRKKYQLRLQLVKFQE